MFHHKRGLYRYMIMTLEEGPSVWDLSSLYKSNNDPKIKQDLKKLKSAILEFKKNYKGKIAKEDGKELGKALKIYEQIQEDLGRLTSYAYLQYAEDMSDQKRTSFYQNISERVNELTTELLFFTLEFNLLTEQELKKKFSQSTALRYYAPWLRDVRAFKNHQLDENLEKLFHERNLTARNNWQRLFEETIADMRFKYDNKELTATKVFDLLSNKIPEVRKKAAKTIGETLEKNNKLFAIITNTLAKDKSIEDNWRNFKQPISQRNLENLLEDEVTDCLIKTVKENYPNLSHRYYKLKAKWFGKKTLDYWDRNAPLPWEVEKIIPYRDAKYTILKSYLTFSPSMGRIAEKFFEKNWIHSIVTPGKDSGAFSHPTIPTANPFILLNYQGKIRDVMTLAHELGHGIHQILASKQGALMCDTPLTLAETASVFGEQLVFRTYLGRAKTPEERRTMLANKVEDMLNTVVRQIAFCEFEKDVHNLRKEKELSGADIGKIWLEKQKEALGPAIKLHPEYQSYWSYIPHFIHTPFYVYAYAFGDCLVNSLYQVYLDKLPGFESKYIKMLQSGGSLRHKELLKPFGLNAADPHFWQKGLNIISSYIDELED